MSDNSEIDTGIPIKELIGHTLEPHPDLGARVQRSINRRTLGADSLEFSLEVMMQTFWAYTRNLFEIIPGVKNHEKED